MIGEDTFWRVIQPDGWPPPPDRLSYSSASEIEACARRWALLHSDYSSSIGVDRYPARPRRATLLGQLAHESLQAIADELRAHGCSGPADPKVVAALRELGGISAVLDTQARKLLDSLSGNPRAEPILDRMRFDIERSLPSLRQLIQGVLQRVFGISPGLDEELPTGRSVTTQQPLGIGFHTEVRLAPQNPRWIGWADAIKLLPDSCELLDYKSGEENPNHRRQIQLYALLWARDTAINPERRLATHLTIVYADKIQAVPPPEENDLDKLEAELNEQSQAIARTLESKPPTASVSPDNCRYCDMKHLCDDFWAKGGQELVRDDGNRLRSIQVRIRRSLGLRSWAAQVEMDSYLDSGTEVVIMSADSVDMTEREAFRLIDVLVEEEQNETPVIHIYRTSEIYLAS